MSYSSYVSMQQTETSGKRQQIESIATRVEIYIFAITAYVMKCYDDVWKLVNVLENIDHDRCTVHLQMQ